MDAAILPQSRELAAHTLGICGRGKSAYSEFVFLDKCWPDFEKEDLAAAIREYQSCRGPKWDGGGQLVPGFAVGAAYLGKLGRWLMIMRVEIAVADQKKKAPPGGRRGLVCRRALRKNRCD